MNPDKNLFVYDLAIVAVFKDESAYLKEWIEYHLLAGVNHFFLYDNDSSDNPQEILQPYIENGTVTYIPYPGSRAQLMAYYDAVSDFKFLCRYMAFIDIDEFIFPQSNKSIVEVADEILSGDEFPAGLCINWHCFGSGKDDGENLSGGVLERFKYRADNISYRQGENEHCPNKTVKTIACPTRMEFFVDNPHYPLPSFPFKFLNDEGNIVTSASNIPITDKKICLNHYWCKTFKEFEIKMRRGRADILANTYDRANFESRDINDIFDDGILKYLEERKKMSTGGGAKKSSDKVILYQALFENLVPTMIDGTPEDFYLNKIETFLICFETAKFLTEKFPDDKFANFFLEQSVKAVEKCLNGPLLFREVNLLLGELPKILPLKYPEVKKILQGCMFIIPQMIQYLRSIADLYSVKQLTEKLRLLRVIEKAE